MLIEHNDSELLWGPSCSLSYGSWIYNYRCNQCISTPGQALN